jgi:hypothetical protein
LRSHLSANGTIGSRTTNHQNVEESHSGPVTKDLYHTHPQFLPRTLVPYLSVYKDSIFVPRINKQFKHYRHVGFIPGVGNNLDGRSRLFMRYFELRYLQQPWIIYSFCRLNKMVKGTHLPSPLGPVSNSVFRPSPAPSVICSA